MRRRVNARVATLLVASASVGGLAVPALVRAASGGAGLGTTGGPGVTSPSPTTQVQPANTTVSVSGNGFTISTHASGMLWHPQNFAGNAGSSAAGDTIEIERRGRETHWQWAPTTHATANSNGSFTAMWPANHIGQFAIRAVIVSRRQSSDAPASPSLTITVYRPAIATTYGPGFWGSRTACGEILNRGTVGVANRTLKCGTSVAIYYHGRTLVVPVIDRGPYANHADWDLTMATAGKLKVPGTVTIGAVSLPASH